MRLALAEFVIAGVVLAVIPAPSRAAWSTDPNTNNPVIVAPGNQRFPSLIPDGAGGAFVAWYDDVIDGVSGFVHVQHLLSSGDLDANWPDSGLSAGISDMPTSWTPPALVPNGAGGVIVGYESLRSGRWHPYADRLLGTGAEDPVWSAGGEPLCMSLFNQHDPSAQPDGSGGAILVWRDFRGATRYDIYAAHVSGGGVVDPGSPFAGVPVCTVSGDLALVQPVTCSDGSGGALAFWTDFRATSSGQVYGHHVKSDGSVDSAWPVNGLLVDPNASKPSIPVADGSGGAFVAGSGNFESVFHVRSDGTLDPVWPTGGVAVGAAPFTNPGAALVSDGAGGVMVAWTVDYVIHAQHVFGTGVIDASWPVDGAAVTGSAIGTRETPVATPDGNGGLYIAWSDERAGYENADIYAAHVLSDGTLESGLPPSGLPVSTAAGKQNLPQIVSDAAGGAIVTWEDWRKAGPDIDIYAQRIPFGSTTSVGPADAPAATRLDRVAPNPARSRATISGSLASATSTRLSVLDVGGRVVRRLAAGTFGAGRFERSWDLLDESGRRVAPGLYFVILESGTRISKRFVVQP